MTERLKEQLDSLPTDPGIYKYFDDSGELIYVGKAVNLRNRVRSYFSGPQSPKTQVLVANIVRLETIVVQSEVDALILEANLIKEHRPRYNIILKDDKSHLYIKITTYEELPRISTCRQTDIQFDLKALYFGPYPSSGIAKQTLRYLRRVFPYLAHHQPPAPGRRRPPQSFFYYNLPLLAGDQSIDKQEYRKQIFQLVHFLEGKRQSVSAELEKQMQAAAKSLEFEQAARLKQQLDGIAYVTQRSISPETYIANPELIQGKREEGLRELATTLAPYFLPQPLPRPDQESDSRRSLPRTINQDEHEGISKDIVHAEKEKYPKIADVAYNLQPTTYNLRRIECYDISNTGGEQSVGSMVVFEDGEAKKSDYRKFKIKQDGKPNDFAMMEEVLTRRFKRLAGSIQRPGISDKLPHPRAGEDSIPEQAERESPKKSQHDGSFSTVPDLIIIDGGKGQLTVAQVVLKKLDLDIPMVGLTKRYEELVVATGRETFAKATDNFGVNSTSTPAELSINHGGRHSVKANRSGAHAAIARTSEDLTTQVAIEENFAIIRVPRGSEALFLLQRIRDEAHRFAITYHRKLRGKAFLSR